MTDVDGLMMTPQLNRLRIKKSSGESVEIIGTCRSIKR